MAGSGDLEQEVLRGLLEERSPVLLGIIGQLQEANAQLRAEVLALKQRVAELEAQNRPPAAPFRRGPEQKRGSGGRPGRGPGHPGSYRQTPDVVDEELEVPLSLLPRHCPCCGQTRPWEPQACVQYIEELPPTRPRVSKLTTWSRSCRGCGHTLASRHPAQVSEAGGCAGTQLGARAQALAASLRHGCGLSYGKTAQLLRDLCGLSITRGGLAALFGRMSGKLRPAREALEQQLRAAPAVHTDETSWWIGGPASLWVFATADLTLYRTVAHRDRATFHQTLPPDWPGVLVSDCLAVYDGATPLQQKCYSHHLRALSVAAQDCAAPGWVSLVKRLLHRAMDLGRRAAAPTADERRGLHLAAQTLLEQPRADPAEERLRTRLYKQRDHLFTFLEHPGVDPTNNLAERELRPAVIARKLSCGHRSPHGAQAWATLASLIRTCARRSKDFAQVAAPALLLAPPRP